MQSYNLTAGKVLNLYNALTGKQIQQERFWEAFKKSVRRRSEVVHSGARISKADAEATHEVAMQVIQFLK